MQYLSAYIETCFPTKLSLYMIFINATRQSLPRNTDSPVTLADVEIASTTRLLSATSTGTKLKGLSISYLSDAEAIYTHPVLVLQDLLKCNNFAQNSSFRFRPRESIWHNMLAVKCIESCDKMKQKC